VAETPSDIGALAKQIGAYQVQSPSDIRTLSEMCRVLGNEVAEVFGYAEFEIVEAVSHLDAGKRGRARKVARPLRHAVTLSLYASRRAGRTYLEFRKAFAEELAAKTRARAGRREWNWKQD
jgi:hypothetical protein